MSFPEVNVENFLIPLKEIELATQSFGKENRITNGDFGEVFIGKLSESRKNCTAAFKRFIQDRCHGKKEFLNELKFISSLKHENIIPFIGYCDEANEMIIVYEYHVNASLADHLHDPQKRSFLTWPHRLNICIDVARGLSYLHSGLKERGIVTHGSVMHSNMLLDNNLRAKISGFELSVLIPGDQPRPKVYKPTRYLDKCDYVDPIHLATGFLEAQSDVYSFGVLLYHMLTRTSDFKIQEYSDGYGKPKSLIMLVQRYGLEKLIDPVIRVQIGGPSYLILKELAYKCVSLNIKDRPTMDTIAKKIKEALEIFNDEEVAPKITKGRSIHQNVRQLLIPLEEIKLATGNFSKDYWLRSGIIGDFYKGQLSERWQSRTVIIKTFRKKDCFRNELDIVTRSHHENIIKYIGHCEGNELIIVFEYSINGSLIDHLANPNKLHCITWEQRLKICIGAARGLKFLHLGLLGEERVIHRRVTSEMILLDDNMEAKISDFDFSISLLKDQPQLYEALEFDVTYNSDYNVYYDMNYFDDYMDPIYKESDIVNVEIDLYSFGVVMCEIMCGLQAWDRRMYDIDAADDDEYTSENATSIHCSLIKRVHRYYDDGLDKLIDSSIKDQTDVRSLLTFAETAYKCLSFNKMERPSMNKIIRRIEEALYIQKHGAATTIQKHLYQKLEDLLIPFKEINLATSDFSSNSLIGKGGFGVVYKGRLSERWKNHEVAIKRLNKTVHRVEFFNELELISRFCHQNIIPFIGYCDENDEMILVFEYANNGGLDGHLQDKNKRRHLTWARRLKICLGAAKGLENLHSGLGEDQKVIHGDVKSGNILLDDNLEAKICDFGLSKSERENNNQQTQLYTHVGGTNFYMDPIYHESGILQTNSDVYSFGVIMFELLSGMLVYNRRKLGDGKPKPLINLVRRCYDNERELLIDPVIKDQIDVSSFHTYIETAYQCISFNIKDRPSMDTIIDKIEEALDYQLQKDIESRSDQENINAGSLE